MDFPMVVSSSGVLVFCAPSHLPEHPRVVSACTGGDLTPDVGGSCGGECKRVSVFPQRCGSEVYCLLLLLSY